jgi:nucleoside-diphosphate-sugar epimerase
MRLVTGATGIVGSHVVLALCREGHRVRALVRAGSDRRFVERLLGREPDGGELLARVHWCEGDVLDPVSLAAAMDGVRQVVHCAALVSFDPRDDEALLEVNVEGTAHVVNAALEAGVERLCHVSSIAALGTATDGAPVTEDTPWAEDEERSVYAVSKYAAELEVHRGVAEGLDAVLVNPSLIIGPGLPGRSSRTIADRLRTGTRWYPPGRTSAVDVRDVAEVCVRLLREPGAGQRYLIAGESITYQRLFGLFCAAFGKPAPTRPIRPWMLELAWRVERLRTLLFRRRPLITRDTARTSLRQRRFDDSKLRGRLGLTLRSAEEAVRYTVSLMDARPA